MSPLSDFAGALFAADPFIGTWKLNHDKSNYTAGMPPREETVVIRQESYRYRVIITGVEPDGSPISIQYTVAMDGGTGEAIDGPYDTISSK